MDNLKSYYQSHTGNFLTDSIEKLVRDVTEFRKLPDKSSKGNSEQVIRSFIANELSKARRVNISTGHNDVSAIMKSSEHLRNYQNESRRAENEAKYYNRSQSERLRNFTPTRRSQVLNSALLGTSGFKGTEFDNLQVRDSALNPNSIKFNQYGLGSKNGELIYRAKLSYISQQKKSLDTVERAELDSVKEIKNLKQKSIKQENRIKDEIQPSDNKAPKASLFSKIRLDAMAAAVIDSLSSSATSYARSNVQASMLNVQSNTGMSSIVGAIGQQFENSASIKQSVGNAIGAVIGGTIGGLTAGIGGALIGSQLGSGAGGYVGSLLGNKDLIKGEGEKLKALQIQYSYFDSTMSQRYADSALSKNPLTAKFKAGDKEITMSGKSSLGLDKLSETPGDLQYSEQILAARRSISGKHDTSVPGGYATDSMKDYAITLNNMGVNPSQQPRMMTQFAQLTKGNDKTLGDQVARGAEYYVKYGELTADKLDMVIALTRQGVETDKAYSLVGQSQLGNTGAQDKIAFNLQDPVTKMVSGAMLSSMGLDINNVLENGLTDAQLKEMTGKGTREGAIADIMDSSNVTSSKFLLYQALGGQGTINALNNTNKGIAQEGMKPTVDSNGNIITPSSLASKNPAESAAGKAIDILKAELVSINNPTHVSINGVDSRAFSFSNSTQYMPSSPNETIRQLYQGVKVGSTAMSTGKQY